MTDRSASDLAITKYFHLSSFAPENCYSQIPYSLSAFLFGTANFFLICTISAQLH